MTPEEKEAKITALNQMTSEELIEFFGSNASIWACHGVGMLRSAYVVWGIFWERMKRNYQSAKDGEKITGAFLLDSCTDRFVHAYKLLAACAMENLAKGLVIAKDKLSIQDHKLPQWFISHDIVSLLSQQVGFQFNDEERRALTDSTKAIIWQTRYPMPKDATHLSQQWPGMEFAQRFNHPVDFRDLAIRMLRDYPDEAFHTEGVLIVIGASDLIRILELECPEPENLQ